MKQWLVAFIAVTLLGVAALVWAYPAGMLAPGPLLPAHAAVAGLADDCFACHTPFRGAAAERCISCHTVADIGLRRVGGSSILHATPQPAFHQALASTDCLGCHTDHPGASLVPPHSHGFAHAMLAPVVGANCAGCHAPPRDALHLAPVAACGTCHSQTDWAPAHIDHTRYFALTGPHEAACTTCHTGGDVTRYTCYGCHAHQQAEMIEAHREEGIGNIAACVSCHRSTRGEGRDGGDGREGED